MINLSDLGRPTRRGIKKCPKCGTENGFRGVICKNKNCDAVFKDLAEKRRISLDAVRLSGILRHIYSVRVKDNINERGFVQLPYLSTTFEDDVNKTLSKDALCFVDSCQRIFDDSILKYHETDVGNSSGLCSHIESAINSTDTATPIEFKTKTLEILNVPGDIKEKLWILDLEQEGPLVQRVSKTVMAVKCQVSSEHPLGYLHCTFRCSKGGETFDEFSCSCTEFKISERTSYKLKCIHYYACICALITDSRYFNEFSKFLLQDFPNRNVQKTLTLETSTIHPIDLFPNHKVVQNNPNIKSSDSQIYQEPAAKKQMITPKSNIINTAYMRSNIQSSKNLYNRTKKEVKHVRKVRHKPIILRYRKLAPNPVVQIKVLEETNTPAPIIEPVWAFLDWLAYVTESINHTMLFENLGNINDLTFCIPEAFYNEFTRRIPSGYQATIQNNIITYSIMNIRHVKEIFDTPKVKLKISKRIAQINGNYMEINEDEDQSHDSSFIFFLNVGASTVDENNDTNNAFIVEWMPNITQVSMVGQLKLRYKYGHKST